MHSNNYEYAKKPLCVQYIEKCTYYSIKGFFNGISMLIVITYYLQIWIPIVAFSNNGIILDCSKLKCSIAIASIAGGVWIPEMLFIVLYLSVIYKFSIDTDKTDGSFDTEKYNRNKLITKFLFILSIIRISIGIIIIAKYQTKELLVIVYTVTAVFEFILTVISIFYICIKEMQIKKIQRNELQRQNNRDYDYYDYTYSSYY